MSGSDFHSLNNVATLCPETKFNVRELVIPVVQWPIDRIEGVAPDFWNRVVECRTLSRLTLEHFSGTTKMLHFGQPAPIVRPFECGVVEGRRLTVAYFESRNPEDDILSVGLLVQLAATAQFLSVHTPYAFRTPDTRRTVTYLASLVHRQIRRLYYVIPMTQMVVGLSTRQT